MKQKSKNKASNNKPFKKDIFTRRIFFESFGVRICVASNDSEGIEAIQAMLPTSLANSYILTDEVEARLEYSYVWNVSGRDEFFINGNSFGAPRKREDLLAQFGNEIRVAVVQSAVDRVFIHAGVVAWKGRAIMLPAASFDGKSTLTAELIRRGAEYYSDEYAVLDKNGWVSPFPQMLSIRGSGPDHQQVDYPVEDFGGKAGTKRIPVGMVLLTKYKPNAKWQPKILSNARGLLEIIRHTIPIRTDPAFVLRVLNNVATNSVLVKSSRGEARDFVDRILHFFESRCFREPS